MDKENIIQQHLSELKKFVSQQDTTSCKTYLDYLDSAIKGGVFEHFLADLYRGNGFHVEVKGGRGDKGADLIVKTSASADEISFIIQAKNWKKPLDTKDTYTELSQFREETVKVYNCKRYRLISLNGFVSDAYKYQKKGWLSLYNSDHISELFSNYDSEVKRIPSVDLRTHNKQTYEELNRLKQYIKHISVIQATGTGKSYLIYQLFAANLEKKKLLIAPSKYIIEQFQKNEKYGWLMDGVDTLHYQNRQMFLDENLVKKKYDVIVLDEFHRTGAKTYEPKVKSLLAHNPDALVLGATATPIRSDGRNMNEEFQFEAASDISLPIAIVKGHIPNPTYVASMIDLEEEIEQLKKALEQSKNPNINKEEEKRKLDEIKLDWKKSNDVDKILKKYLGNTTLRNFIVFCDGIDTLRKYKHRVSEWFVDAGFNDVQPFTVHSDNSDKENDDALIAFENFADTKKIALLFAVDMFNEGLHIKNVDGVILLRKTTSHIVFYQQIGRCLQVGKRSPIIFDLVNNFSSVEASNFLNELNEAKEQEQKELSDEGLDDDTPTFKVVDLTKDIREILEAIEAKFQTWDFWFGLLLEWKKDKVANPKGASHIPLKKIYKGYKLGFWYDNRRNEEARLKIKFPERYQKLVDYGIEFKPEVRGKRINFLDSLREKVSLLKQYYDLNGTTAIPKRKETADKLGHKGWDKSLAIYVHHTLRPNHWKRIVADKNLTCIVDGKEVPIHEYLLKLNFNEGKEKVVDIMIKRLKFEIEKNPNFNEADFAKLIKEDKVFARDVNRLRNHMNDLDGYSIDYFDEGEVEELLSLRFVPARKAITWNERYNDLLKLYEEKGTCKFKQSENWGFHQWCKEQVNFKNKLTKEQIDKLNVVRFFEVWEKGTLSAKQLGQQEKKFKENIQLLVNLYKTTGSFKPERNTKERNFINNLIRYGVSKERLEYAKSQGVDVEGLRAQIKKRGVSKK